MNHSAHAIDVPAEDHVGIVDALYRFGAGQDLGDRHLFESAFSSDAQLDFTGPARRLGVDLPIFRGRNSIVDSIMTTVSRLHTTHTVTNPRVIKYDGSRAHLFALVEAQHLPKDNHQMHLLLKNIYWMDLHKDGKAWVIDTLKIDNVWMTGDSSVLFSA
jgi:hypothetical protein